MKQLIYILTYLIFTSCGQTNTKKEKSANSEKNMVMVFDTISVDKNSEIQNNSTENEQREDYGSVLSLSYFKKVTLYKLTDTIISDFNGDGISDKAFYLKENETSGVIIKHGQTNEEIRIGFDKQFAHFSDFNWANYWGLVEDRETNETTFTKKGDVLGERKVKLQNCSIVIEAEDRKSVV